MLKTLAIIKEFLGDPGYTIQKNDARDIKLGYVIILLFLANMSNQISIAISQNLPRSFFHIMLSTFTSLILYVTFLLLFLAIIAFVASFYTEKSQTHKLLIFSFISFLPSLIFTPVSMTRALLGVSISNIIIFLIIIYEIYLFIVTLKTTLSLSTRKIVVICAGLAATAISISILITGSIISLSLLNSLR